MSRTNFRCARCGERYFYSPNYRDKHSLCESCRETANWFWKLRDLL